MKKSITIFYLLLIIVFYFFTSCKNQTSELCIENIKIVGNGLRINIDSVKEEQLWKSFIEADQHQYISLQDYSTIEIDTNSLQAVYKAYSLFRKEVQEGSYAKTHFREKDSIDYRNTVTVSPLEMSMVFKETRSLSPNSFANYEVKITNDICSNSLLLGQKTVELFYWEIANQTEKKSEIREFCLQLENSMKIDSAFSKTLDLDKLVEGFTTDNHVDFVYFSIGYQAEYLRICHELYNQLIDSEINDPNFSYLGERIAKGNGFLEFANSNCTIEKENHFFKDLKHIESLYNGARQ